MQWLTLWLLNHKSLIQLLWQCSATQEVSASASLPGFQLPVCICCSAAARLCALLLHTCMAIGMMDKRRPSKKNTKPSTALSSPAAASPGSLAVLWKKIASTATCACSSKQTPSHYVEHRPEKLL